MTKNSTAQRVANLKPTHHSLTRGILPRSQIMTREACPSGSLALTRKQIPFYLFPQSLYPHLASDVHAALSWRNTRAKLDTTPIEHPATRKLRFANQHLSLLHVVVFHPPDKASANTFFIRYVPFLKYYFIPYLDVPRSNGSEKNIVALTCSRMSGKRC